MMWFYARFAMNQWKGYTVSQYLVQPKKEHLINQVQVEETEQTLESLTKVYAFLKHVNMAMNQVFIEYKYSPKKQTKNKINLRNTEPDEEHWIREVFDFDHKITLRSNPDSFLVREIKLVTPKGVLVDRAESDGYFSTKSAWIFNRYIEIFTNYQNKPKEKDLECVIINSSGMTKYSNDNTPLLIEVSDGIRKIISV